MANKFLVAKISVLYFYVGYAFVGCKIYNNAGSLYCIQYETIENIGLKPTFHSNADKKDIRYLSLDS